MKHVNRNLIFAALAALAALAASCSLPFDLPSSAAAEGAGRVVLTVSPGEAGSARTILPGKTQFSRYELIFTRAGAADITVDTSAITGTGISQELVAGTWTVAVSAYNSFTPTGGSTTEYLAARGSAQVSVSAGQIARVTVNLEPEINSGVKGIFTYTVTFPRSVSSATLTLTDGANPVQKSLTSGSKVSVEAAPGYYDLFIVLRNGSESAGAAEKVHIYSGLESEVEYVFDDDLSLTKGPGEDNGGGNTDPVPEDGDITGTYTGTGYVAGATLTVTAANTFTVSIPGEGDMSGTYSSPDGITATLNYGGSTFGTAVLNGNILTVTPSAASGYGDLGQLTFTRSSGTGTGGDISGDQEVPAGLQEYFNGTPADFGITQSLSADNLLAIGSDSLVSGLSEFIAAGGELYVNGTKVTSGAATIQPNDKIRILGPIESGGTGSTGTGDNNSGTGNTGLQEYFSGTPAELGITQSLSADNLLAIGSDSLVSSLFEFIALGGELHVNGTKVTSGAATIQPNDKIRILGPIESGSATGGTASGGIPAAVYKKVKQ
jgi:uncharacterized protein YdeI (BOF family)